MWLNMCLSVVSSLLVRLLCLVIRLVVWWFRVIMYVLVRVVMLIRVVGLNCCV